MSMQANVSMAGAATSNIADAAAGASTVKDPRQRKKAAETELPPAVVVTLSPEAEEAKSQNAQAELAKGAHGLASDEEKLGGLGEVVDEGSDDHDEQQKRDLPARTLRALRLYAENMTD